MTVNDFDVSVKLSTAVLRFNETLSLLEGNKRRIMMDAGNVAALVPNKYVLESSILTSGIIYNWFNKIFYCSDETVKLYRKNEYRTRLMVIYI